MNENLFERAGLDSYRSAELIDLLQNATALAGRLLALSLNDGGRITSPVNLNLARNAAWQTANALIASAVGKCDIDPKNPQDIELITDSNGRLIYRCYHNPDHRWDLNGNRIK